MSQYVYDDQDCPVRDGVMLTHIRDKDGRCRFCNKTVYQAKDEPLDVPTTLAAMGIVNGQNGELSPDCIVAHDSLAVGSLCGTCGIRHEGVAVLGKGPQGPVWGRARGDLTPADQRRLIFYCETVQRRELAGV